MPHLADFKCFNVWAQGWCITQPTVLLHHPSAPH